MSSSTDKSVVQAAFPSANMLKALYTGNMLWHSSAFFYFTFRPAVILRKYSKRKHSLDPLIKASRGGDAWHHDIGRWLGVINGGYAVLACLRMYGLVSPSKLFSGSSVQEEARLNFVSLIVLGLANFSQAFMNFYSGWTADRWILGQGMDMITSGDALFTVLDFAAAACIPAYLK